MKRNITILLYIIVFLGCISCSKQETLTNQMKAKDVQLMIDSISAPAILYIKKQSKEDFEKRLIIELPFKIDSLLKIKQSQRYADTLKK